MSREVVHAVVVRILIEVEDERWVVEIKAFFHLDHVRVVFSPPF